MLFTDLRDYLAYQLGFFSGALALTFLISRLFRAMFFQHQRGMLRSIGPNVAAFVIIPTWFGWAQARGGTPAWLSLYVMHALAGVCMALIDVWRDRRTKAREARTGELVEPQEE